MGYNMDGNLILEFQTKSQAEMGLAVINAIAAAWWQSQGYTVINNQLIGKNAATGEDMPEAARTITWDTVKQSPDNTWYISSPASNPNFVNWRDHIPQGVQMPADKVFPAEWIPNQE